MAEKNILDVKNLIVDIITPSGIIHPVKNVNLVVAKKEILGIIGESGSGKSVTIKSVMRLHNEKKIDIKGDVLFEGKNILNCSEKEMKNIRGSEISMIFQDPMVSLNPIKTIGKQLVEMILNNEKVSKQEAKERVLAAFRKVEINPPEERFNQYPFELSGGMLQRIVIAMSIVCNSKLLLADEPTTALDVSTQEQVLKLIKDIRDKEDMAVIVVTHNFGVVAEICDTVAVMYAGEIVESGDVREIFNNPKHPYTKALMKSRPSKELRGKKMETIKGVPSSLYSVPEGCSFAPRCSKATELCFSKKPKVTIEDGHMVACSLFE